MNDRGIPQVLLLSKTEKRINKRKKNKWNVNIFKTFIMCLSIGTPKMHEFSTWDKWKINSFKGPNA